MTLEVRMSRGFGSARLGHQPRGSFGVSPITSTSSQTDSLSARTTLHTQSD